MAIKIGKWYITRNNPRQLLNQQAFLLEELYKYRGIEERIKKTIEAIDDILVYNKFNDTTKGFGNVKRELKFYLSDCDTLEEFDKREYNEK